MTVAAIIVAAGRGTRAGGDIPKQWQVLGDRPVAAYAMARFANHPAITQVILVLHPDDLDTPPTPLPPTACRFPAADVPAARPSARPAPNRCGCFR